MNKFFFLLLILIPSFTVQTQSANSSEDIQSLHEDWEETLQFGIESDVLSTIDAMIEEKVDDLSDRVSELFSNKRIEIRTKSLDFFEAFEDDALIPAVLSELEFYQDIADLRFTVRLIQHLERRKHDIDDDLWLLLEEMLGEEGEDVRSAIVSYTGSLKYQSAAVILEDIYQDASIFLQEAVLKALGQIQDESSQELIHSLAGDENIEKSLRIAAIQAAGAYGNEQSLDILSQTFSSPDPLLRNAAVSALSNFPPSDTQALYLEALRDSFWRVRLTALKGIEQNPFSDALPALIYMSRQDPEINIKQQALKSIASLNVPDGWIFLQEMLADEALPDIYRQSAAVFLVQENFAASQTVIEKVMVSEWEKKNSRLLDTICKELSTETLPSAEDLYERMLGHENFVIQIYGVRGIGRNKILRLRPSLVTIMESKDSHRALKSSAEAVLEQF